MYKRHFSPLHACCEDNESASPAYGCLLSTHGCNLCLQNTLSTRIERSLPSMLSVVSTKAQTSRCFMIPLVSVKQLFEAKGWVEYWLRGWMQIVFVCTNYPARVCVCCDQRTSPTMRGGFIYAFSAPACMSMQKMCVCVCPCVCECRCVFVCV